MQTTTDNYRLKTSELFAAEAVPHLPVLKRLALHLVRNPAQADDLVQETFAQALQSFDRYETGTNCRAWLCKIMFYKRSQWIRANSRFCQLDENEMQFPAVTYAALPTDYGRLLSSARCTEIGVRARSPPLSHSSLIFFCCIIWANRRTPSAIG